MKRRGRALIQNDATHKAEIINTADYRNTKYAEDQFVDIVKSHGSNQTNMN
jgi:hypothetical protein